MYQWPGVGVGSWGGVEVSFDFKETQRNCRGCEKIMYLDCDVCYMTADVYLTP